MTALAGCAEVELWPVGGGVSATHAGWATARWPTDPTVPDLLADAAGVLPMVVGRGPVRCVDVHTALYDAACGRGVGRDRPHRLRLADEALARFATYLVVEGVAVPAERIKELIGGWLTKVDLAEVRRWLVASARFWLPERSIPERSTPERSTPESGPSVR